MSSFLPQMLCKDEHHFLVVVCFISYFIKLLAGVALWHQAIIVYFIIKCLFLFHRNEKAKPGQSGRRNTAFSLQQRESSDITVWVIFHSSIVVCSMFNSSTIWCRFSFKSRHLVLPWKSQLCKHSRITFNALFMNGLWLYFI